MKAALVIVSDYPLVPVGSGAVLMFEREYPSYTTAMQAPVIVVEFFQGSQLHHTGRLHPGACAMDCGLSCAQGDALTAEDVKYGFNASFEPESYECMTCSAQDDFVGACK